ncbi:hypothetical protein OKA04_04175 [Luteolibacter flavescens]|uniref:Uncharacterized protein n=1 Tax=Luteolibacter flavescens TaxID=1859460 RepID=A0ABT3FKY3_9BACT|nr:hypothetical protein [Luteolibacter flavescens]MCW1883911.1 hypothetical protein [Luteolibacter flavescens]
MPDAEEEKPEPVSGPDAAAQDAAMPDLDELLEEFREPAEAPRKKRQASASFSFILALVLCVAAVWLASRVQPGSRANSRVPTSGLSKPSKTEGRKAREQITDVVADYTARCEKGMSEREIRWIVEDFRDEGLDDGPGSFSEIVMAIMEPLDFEVAGTQKLLAESVGTEPAAKLKAAGLLWAVHQQDWYGGALAEALRLTSEQKREMKESGRHFVKESEGDFLQMEKAMADGEGGGPERSYVRDRIYSSLIPADLMFPATGLLDPAYWLRLAGSAPGERCRLEPWQADVLKLGEGEEAGLPGRLDAVNQVLPVLTGQKFPADGNDVLGLAKALHPSQLKILLLLDPELAGELMADLDKSNE